MADITWSAYALAMFTPEQRAAAVNAVPDEGTLRPIPPPPLPSGTGIPTQTGMGRILVNGTWYDPNIPIQQKVIFEAGWRFFGGKWVAPVGGRARTDDELARDGDPGGRAGLSSVVTAAAIPGGSVLGNAIPSAPPVLLPSFVGGRIGVVRIGGGMRPQSGGNPDRVRFGPMVGGKAVLPVVRMSADGGTGGGGSW